jgi:glycosyltransferase involved in cell wall biosynthesis
MRILFVSDVYFPRVNGVSTSINTFRTDLQRLGVDSVLVAPAYAASDGAEEPGICRVPAGRVPRDPEDRRMYWGALLRTLRQLPGRFDLVHVQSPFLAHYAGVRYAHEIGVPVVETYHTLFEEYLHHYVPVLPRVLGRALARQITRSQCADVDMLIAPSEPMRVLLAQYGVRSPLRVIPTGLPEDRFTPGDGQRFRAAHGVPNGRPLLLYVGRVAHEKNIDFLLHSFVELRRSRPDALLLIAGEGPARAHLASVVTALGLGRDVQFVGYLDRARGLQDCYAAADVFVFASRTETQGLVLLEAMAQGRPVVSTAVLGTASILKSGCGAQVVPEESAAFARAIYDILEEPPRAARLGAQGLAYARTWASSLMAERMIELYGDVLRAATERSAAPGRPLSNSPDLPSGA